MTPSFISKSLFKLCVFFNKILYRIYTVRLKINKRDSILEGLRVRAPFRARALFVSLLVIGLSRDSLLRVSDVHHYLESEKS